MTLEELHQRAMKLRHETVAFCDATGFRQHSVDIMGPLEKVIKTTAVSWSRGKHGYQTIIGSPETSPNRDKVMKMTARMADAIDVYLYAKQHGVEAAMIWKLSR